MAAGPGAKWTPHSKLAQRPDAEVTGGGVNSYANGNQSKLTTLMLMTFLFLIWSMRSLPVPRGVPDYFIGQ
jgi:hypothetical protein